MGVACSLRRVLRHGAYPSALLPPAVVSSFADTLDTLLGVRARLALAFAASPRLRSRGHADLALSPLQLGALCSAMAGLPGAALRCAGGRAGRQGAGCSKSGGGSAAGCLPVSSHQLLFPLPRPRRRSSETLQALDQHLLRFASSYSAISLANVLHCCAVCGHSLSLSPRAEWAACERALHLLQPTPGGAPAQPAITLGALARLLVAIAALGINHPRLLHTLLGAARALLAPPTRGAPRGDLARLAAALGQLPSSGLLAPAGVTASSLLPLWRQLTAAVDLAADATGRLAPEHAATLRHAAAQLAAGLAGGLPSAFALPVVAAP